MGGHLVRIRIYGIIGFSGFSRRASLMGERLSAIVLAGFLLWRKARVGRSEILKNPANPVNPDSDKDAGLDNQALRPKSSLNSNRRLLSIYGLTGGRLTLNSIGLSLRRRSELAPVIPAKAGIQSLAAMISTRNQVQIAAGGSLLPLWAYRGRF